MARIYPELTETMLLELPSQAEAKVYRCLRDSLDDRYLIIHGKSFIAPRKSGGHKDGEADFVIFSAKQGLLIIEVKGGGIRFDPARGWQSVDRRGEIHEIKNPVAQAKNQKYAILNQLNSNRVWTNLRKRMPAGHAVLLPDIESIEELGLSECPNEIIGSRSALDRINAWLDQVYGYWMGRDDVPLGLDGLKVVEQVFCSPIIVRPLLRDILKVDEKLRIKLTNEQASVLRILSRHKRAAIVGAAGTGKTILAVEKARRMIDNGAKVLLLCYNKALAVTLRRQFPQSESILVYTYHQFCHHCCDEVVKNGWQNPLDRVREEVPNDDLFDVQLPLAAFYAIEELGDKLQFDAIIIDEGQDFGEEYWLPVEMALRSSERSWLYVFYDENQRLYSRVSSFPIPESDTYPLTKNCRNSKPVHTLAYRYYDGEQTDDSGIEGLNPILISSPTIETQAKQIARHIIKLIHDEGVAPESIAVLVAGQPKDVFYNLLEKETLSKPAKWSREEHFVTNGVLIDTVKRFKGLEREVIFLWLDQLTLSNDAIMYVGISRAKSLLYFVGDSQSLQQLQID
ncbi:NERD domain-containing protein [Methylotuvimicrobium sp. KM1]|uniref:nuclease-related domain-containing DEAD/DEAH box helicase n=1 Tax=Methylotuvimicrobium sp. KM1 TaxID=3377707 RepID=UPI00384CFFF8